MISFACFSPHPPVLLPSVGSPKDREKLKDTLNSLKNLGEKFKKADCDILIISSPHPDWGFNVPIHFIAKSFQKEITPYLIAGKSPKHYFEEGKKIFKELKKDKKYSLIASGDMSHCLKKDGPYGFDPEGPEFDSKMVEFLEKKDIDNFLKLNELYPQAGECGLRSFSFILGILEGSGIGWQPEVLSYEGPFGVGYLVVDFKLNI